MQGRRNIFRSGGTKILDNKMHVKSRGSGGIPPGNFVNRYNVCIHFLYKNESESIFNDLHNTLHQITELLHLIAFVLFYYFIKVHGRLSPLLFKSGGAIAPFAPLLLRLCMPKCTPGIY